MFYPSPTLHSQLNLSVIPIVNSDAQIALGTLWIWQSMGGGKTNCPFERGNQH